jgi:sec-independent protein translocase protein TatA
MFTGWDRPSHWLVLAVVVVVLVGYKKLPEAARSLGRSLRIFKTEIKGMADDDAAREAAKTPPADTPANLTKSVPAEPQPPTAPAAGVAQQSGGEAASASPQPASPPSVTTGGAVTAGGTGPTTPGTV